MLHWSGEAEGSDWRTPAERDPCVRPPGQNRVLPHTEKGSAVTQRILQVLQRHFAAVS